MISVFLPAYNEELALPIVAEKFIQLFKKIDRPYRIVVLDDGSTDSTREKAERLLEKYNVALLKHERNLGLGQTIKDGLAYVAEHSDDEDIVITMDCDDTHDPVYAASALKKIEEGYDVVILSRYQPGGGEKGLSGFKSLLSRGAGWFLKLFFPIEGVREYSCGYRVFKASTLRKMIQVFGKDFVKLTHMGFVVTPELLIKFRMLGSKIVEVPFVLHYDQKPSPSKNQPLRTILGYFALIWCFWGRRLPKS